MRWLVVAALAILSVPSVAAHAVYLDSSPAKGERLTEAPREVWVLLTEPVDPTTYSFEVVSSTGSVVSTGKALLVPGPQARLSVALQSNAPEGAYLAKWQVLSTADGHITSGSTGFAIGDSAAIPEGTGSEATQASALSPVVRLLSFLGMAVVAGALVFLFLARDTEWIRAALPKTLLVGATLNAAGVAGLLLDTVQGSGLPASDIAQTSVGMVLIVRLAASMLLMALAVVAVKVRRISKPSATWAIVLLALASACSARLGHASLAGASSILVDFMHLASVLAWLGGVLVFLVLLFRANREDVPAEDVRALGIRFSPVAASMVAVLVITGLFTTWTITKSYIPELSLFWSPWGRFLGIKVMLLFVMLAIAALNRRLLLGDRFWTHTEEGSAPPRARLRRLVQVESIFGVGTLFMAALLTSISPPSTAALAAEPESQPIMELHGESYMALGSWDQAPASGTSTTFRFRLTNHHGDPVENNTCGRDSCILLEIKPPGESTGVQIYDVQHVGQGRWETEPVLWVGSGLYNATIRIQTADVYLDQLTFTVDVA